MDMFNCSDVIRDKIAEIEGDWKRFPPQYCGEFEAQALEREKQAKVDVLNEVVDDLDKFQRAYDERSQSIGIVMYAMSKVETNGVCVAPSEDNLDERLEIAEDVVIKYQNNAVKTQQLYDYALCELRNNSWVIESNGDDEIK